MDVIILWLAGLIPAMFITWLLFVNVMFAKNKLLVKYTEKWQKYLIYAVFGPLLIVGIVVDIVFNVVYGTLIFFQLPKVSRLFLTARLQHIIEYDAESWRGELAIIICKYLIEPWDYNHCKLERLSQNRYW